jgi:hypothetical protein
MSDTTLDTSYAAILNRAADAIVKRGKAHEDYITPVDGEDPDEWPVDVQGTLADAGGFPPAAWETEAADSAAFRPVREVADLLVDRLGLDPEEAWDESLGRWSDEHSDEHIVAALRDIAAEQTEAKAS